MKSIILISVLIGIILFLIIYQFVKKIPTLPSCRDNDLECDGEICEYRINKRCLNLITK